MKYIQKILALKNKLLVIAVEMLFASQIFAQNQSPVVSNVSFTQREDGSLKVDVYYNVNDAEGNVMTVTMKVSDDNGVTWNYSCNNITGDIGAGITNGTNKHIVWDFAAEHPQAFGDQFRIKIIAYDGIGGIPCPGLSTVSYAGKTYNTVQIGTQCWLKENLDVGTMILGSQNATNNGVIEKYCYNNQTDSCNKYGGLYQWNEAMKYTTNQGTQGICPNGWHIPTFVEFQTLINAVGANGNALKAVGQGTGTNTSGFSALLAGYRSSYNFHVLGNYAYFWSSEGYSMHALYMRLIYYSSTINFYDWNDGEGYSVRCLKD